MRLRIAARAAAAAAVATTLAGCGLADVTGGGGYDFADTLPEVRDDFGKDTKVISILDRDGDVTFVLLGKDGRVHERDYEYVCTTSHSSRGGTSCSKRVRESARRP